MFRSASASTDCASGSMSAGNRRLAAPVDLDGEPRRSADAFELGRERRAGLGRQRRERPLERAAQVAQRLLHLDPAALALGTVQRLLGAERERDPEQALEHALVDLAREVEPLAERASALLLAGHVARGRHQRGGLAERPQQVALAVGELESPAAAIGADHPVGVAAAR